MPMLKILGNLRLGGTYQIEVGPNNSFTLLQTSTNFLFQVLKPTNQ